MDWCDGHRCDDDKVKTTRPTGIAALANFDEALPDAGCGAKKTIDRLLELNASAGGNTGGPRCFQAPLTSEKGPWQFSILSEYYIEA